MLFFYFKMTVLTSLLQCRHVRMNPPGWSSPGFSSTATHVLPADYKAAGSLVPGVFATTRQPNRPENLAAGC